RRAHERHRLRHRGAPRGAGRRERWPPRQDPHRRPDQDLRRRAAPRPDGRSYGAGAAAVCATLGAAPRLPPALPRTGAASRPRRRLRFPARTADAPVTRRPFVISRLAGFLVVLALAAPACAEELRIPVLVPLTGVLALEGTSQRNGALLAISHPPEG